MVRMAAATTKKVNTMMANLRSDGRMERLRSTKGAVANPAGRGRRGGQGGRGRRAPVRRRRSSRPTPVRTAHRGTWPWPRPTGGADVRGRLPSTVLLQGTRDAAVLAHPPEVHRHEDDDEERQGEGGEHAEAGQGR